jgi:hypothetical protein
MQILTLLLALFGLAPAGPATNAPVTIRVEDVQGSALHNELVIVQDLDNSEHEVLRALTDGNGNLPPLPLPPSLYRVIVTAPYGLWQTSVREFLVREKPVGLTVRVEGVSTHGNGDFVLVSAPRAQLQVFRPDGQPASGASILVRDRDATLYLERWYEADAKGAASIELVGDPTVVVVVSGDLLSTTEVTRSDSNPIIRLQEPL